MKGTLVAGRSSITLPADPISVSTARRHVTRVIASWDREDLIDAARLVTSELVANAVKATPDPAPTRCDLGEEEAAMFALFPTWDRQVWLSLYQAPAGVVLEVWDASRVPPKPADPDPWDIGGRGLQIVSQLATTWGYRWPKTGGKVVYAVFREG